jgi:hypothetical protein
MERRLSVVVLGTTGLKRARSIANQPSTLAALGARMTANRATELLWIGDRHDLGSVDQRRQLPKPPRSTSSGICEIRRAWRSIREKHRHDAVHPCG